MSTEKRISVLRRAFPHAKIEDIREFARQDWDTAETTETNLQVFRMWL